MDSGSKILILGAGIIGNFWVSMFHHSGFRKDVWVSEPSQGRREITKKLGEESAVAVSFAVAVAIAVAVAVAVAVAFFVSLYLYRKLDSSWQTFI